MTDKYIIAKYLASENKYEEALTILNELLNEHENSKYLFLKGKILANLNQLESSSQCLLKINEDDAEWEESRAVLSKVNKLKRSKLSFWYYSKISKRNIVITSLLIFFIILTTIFVSMYFADKNDPQLRENVKSISQQSDKISKNIVLLNEIIERNNYIHENDVKEIMKDFSHKNDILLSQMDSLYLNQLQKIAYFQSLLDKDRVRMDSIESRLNEILVLIKEDTNKNSN